MSIHIIHNTFNLEKISIQEPERYNQDLYIWPIQYNHANMFIQTSYLNIINALQYFNNISLSCYHKPIQKSKKKFNTIIKDIDTHMINEIKQLKKNIKHKKKLTYKKSYTTKNKYIYYNFKLQQYNQQIMCDIYDEHKQKTNIEYIQPGSDAYAILWLKNIWLKDNKVGLNYIVVQLKIYKNIIQTHSCLIIEDDDIFTQNKNKNKNKNNEGSDNHTQQISTMEIDPMYRTYVKMLKMGVPRRAVQMKMTMNGIDPNILDTLGNQNKSKKNKITNTLGSISMNPIDLLSGIKNKKLKKVKKNKKNKKKLLLQKLGVHKRSGVPTLEEILKIKNSLKKLNYT
jgi:hypothetical protein